MDNTIEEKARAEFHRINKAEYECALAESQVNKALFEIVKNEYKIAENAFVQGSINQRAIDEELKPKWISVEEKMPDEYTDVVVYCNGYDYFFVAHVGTGGLWYEDTDGSVIAGVTHWISLSEPPK